MKLRNKKTGVIGEVGYISTSTGDILVSNIHDQEEWYQYKSIAELNAEWEDAPEEPKDYWWISPVDTDVVYCVEDVKDEMDQYNKEIGNYFETKEEAENTVEKLKAWKRLKDKGFEITEWKFTPDMKHIKGNFITIKAEIPYILENQADLDLVFGGRE